MYANEKKVQEQLCLTALLTWMESIINRNIFLFLKTYICKLEC